GGLPVVLDGLVIDAAGSASSGVEVTDTPIECRGLVVKNATSRGIKLNGLETGDPLSALLLDCDSFNHGAEGVSVEGAWDLRIEHCDFDANVQEGLDLDKLIAPDGRTTHLTVRHSRFRLNGSDGVDATFAPPLFGGDNGGRFEVRIENCLFERNGAIGLLIDIDYEQAPLWDADLVVRGVTARGNVGAGVTLDLDAQSATIVHRLLSIANQGPGLELTTDLVGTPVLATLSASVLAGNGGAGLQALEDHATPLLAHVVLAGNAGGGVQSTTVRAVAHSSIAWRQPAPWTGASNHHGVTLDDPLAALFARAPVDFGTVTGEDAFGVQLAPGGPALLAGDLVEVSDDGVPRAVVDVAGNDAALDPAPTDLMAPALITRFADGTDVDEDWRTLVGSLADGAGMAAPAGAPVDAGVFGAPLGGLPGVEEAEPTPLFFARDIQPPADTVLGAFDTLSIGFAGGLPAPASASAATVRVVLDAGGSPAATVFVQDGRLIVDAPAGGWTGGSALLELHEGLLSTDGRPLATPIAIPLELP
ncbi:MAG: right-handed parallel beta-helix repeat-containing protein, partial [Planctomycetota bacterium]